MLTEGTGWGYILLTAQLQDTDDECALIETTEDFVLSTRGERLYSMFRFILQLLYDSNLLSDEGLLEWIEKRKAMKGCDNYHGDKDLMKKKLGLFEEETVQVFVDWIENMEDDEDEDEDENNSSSGKSLSSSSSSSSISAG